MQKTIFYVSALLVLGLTGLTANAIAQCTDRLPGPGESDMVFAAPTPVPTPNPNATPTPTPTPDPRAIPTPTPTPKYTHVRAQLLENVRFKVMLDHEMNGGFNKTNDFATFTVMEDVYGIGDVRSPILKRCVIIPKGTKIYGTVDHANSRYPFSIGGKGKLFVTVSWLKLDNGHDNNGIFVPIQFVEPLTPTYRAGHADRHQGITRDCKHSATPCITGRREKIKIPASAIGAGPATGLVVVNDRNSDNPTEGIGPLALWTFLESLSKAGGMDDLINPSNATLKEKLVFDVMTTQIGPNNPLKVWVSLAEKKEEKPAEGKQE